MSPSASEKYCLISPPYPFVLQLRPYDRRYFLSERAKAQPARGTRLQLLRTSPAASYGRRLRRRDVRQPFGTHFTVQSPRDLSTRPSRSSRPISFATVDDSSALRNYDKRSARLDDREVKWHSILPLHRHCSLHLQGQAHIHRARGRRQTHR